MVVMCEVLNQNAVRVVGLFISVVATAAALRGSTLAALRSE